MAFKAVLLRDARRDGVGDHWASLRVWGAGLYQWGYEPIAVELNAADSQDHLAKYLQDPDVAFFLTMQSVGSVLMATDDRGRQRNAFELFAKPVVAVVGDPPFMPWVAEALADDHPYRLFLFHDPQMVTLLQRYGPPRAAHLSSFVGPATDYRRDRTANQVPPRARSARPLFVGSFSDPEGWRAALHRDLPELARVFDEAVEAAEADYRRPLWQHGVSALEAAGENLALAGERHRSFLVHLNQVVRYRRRAALLDRLRDMPVTYIGDAPERRHPQSAALGRRPSAETLKLYETAPSVAMAPPAFSHGIDGRFLNVLARGALAVRPSSPGIETAFTPGRDFIDLAPDFSNVEDGLALAHDQPEAAAAMAERGRAVIDRYFTPDRAAGDLLAELVRTGLMAEA